MNYRRIPNTSIDVSVLCLGTMTFGTPVAKDDAVRLVHWALDHGINFFDTADIYEGYARVPGSAGGVAEKILGEALSGRRDRAVVTTKAGNSVGARPEDSGLSRTHLKRQIEASLANLRTDYVDFFEFHKPDPRTPLEESIAAVCDAVDAGRVRHWGFSNFDVPEIRRMVQICDTNGWPRPVISQPRYNWLHREIEEAHISLCRGYEIAITPYQPLQGGILTGKYQRGHDVIPGSRAAEHNQWIGSLDDKLFDRVEDFAREAATSRLTAGQYAIQWLLEKHSVASVVVGTKSVQQISSFLPVTT
jgi:aryl-alcohol dehydrogenase-like predicted oxidoreductase